jgi:hypothetical protein
LKEGLRVPRWPSRRLPTRYPIDGMSVNRTSARFVKQQLAQGLQLLDVLGGEQSTVAAAAEGFRIVPDLDAQSENID